MAQTKTSRPTTPANRPARPSRTEGGAALENPMVECAQTCAQTLDYCLSQGGDHVEASHIKGLMDCVDICELNARYHARASAWQHNVMEVCAKICRECEQSCSSFSGDAQMEACAEACRRCAEHCEAM